MAELNTSHLRGIERSISQLAHVTEQVAGQVNTVSTKQQEMDSRIIALDRLMNDFIKSDLLAKEIALAEQRVLRVRGELERDFGHYKDVRHRATGLLVALDSGVISDDTIRDTTEEVMVATPRYWLAPCLVALAAWSRDDRDLATRALGEAVRRDPRKTALFYSLVLRRFGRGGTAARWLGSYFDRQDPTALSRDFVLLLDAVATGAYGPDGRAEATETMNVWLEDLEHHQGFLEQQVDRWQDALLALKPSGGFRDYPTLAEHSSEAAALEEALNRARLHKLVHAHFTAIFEGELRTPVELEKMMDDLLDTLVSEFDEEELPLRRQEAEYQAIIDHGGDKSAAIASAAQAQAALEERIDFPTLLTNAAMRPAEAGASKGSERLAVAISRDWIASAYDRVTAEGRDVVPSQIGLGIEGWRGTVSNDTDVDQMSASLAGHIDAETTRDVDAVKFEPISMVIVAVAVAISIALIGAMGPASLLIGLGGIAYGFWIYTNLDKKRDAVRARGEARKASAAEVLHSALAEIVDYHGEWSDEDDEAETTRTLINSITPVDQMAVSTHGSREVI